MVNNYGSFSSPKDRVVGPVPNGLNGLYMRVTNYLLTGMIQIPCWWQKLLDQLRWTKNIQESSDFSMKFSCWKHFLAISSSKQGSKNSWKCRKLKKTIQYSLEKKQHPFVKVLRVVFVQPIWCFCRRNLCKSLSDFESDSSLRSLPSKC